MISMRSKTFATLLDYDGFEFVFEQGYVARFRFYEEEGSSRHGYRYSLTLHGPDGARILGYDNSHAISHKSGKFRRRSATADHWHRDERDKGTPYQFTSSEKLFEDFYQSVQTELSR